MEEKGFREGDKVNNLASAGEKERYVKSIFSTIAKRYDLLNTLLSFGLHRHWKRFAVKLADLSPGDTALDICSGTGDLAILLSRKVGLEGKVVALDFCQEMLKLAQEKIEATEISNCTFVHGNAEELEFPTESFNAVTVGFGMRNVANIDKVFKEMHRVLKPYGRAICLEFSHPTSLIFRILYDFYSFKILPRIGGFISGKSDAYFYLPNSIREFPSQDELKIIMEKVGFSEVRYYNLTGGIVAIHLGIKC
ncbi:MAG: bifunctional demethylmenaquinone methyltransferase/2-methoxy-6-polyprenyl-1,4-benzoquinol methylase UbiE [Actinomycetota bacterium]